MKVNIWDKKEVKFKELQGQTLINVTVNESDDIITFTTTDNVYYMLHYQSCCEDVHISEIHGDLNDLIGSVIVLAEEVLSKTPITKFTYSSETWSFYKLVTQNSFATIRWFGVSNGHYSETVELYKVI